jgi:uncharacterized membrane protein
MKRTDLAARRALLVATASVQRARLTLEARVLRAQGAELLHKGRQGAWVAAVAAVAATTFAALRGRPAGPALSLGLTSPSGAAARSVTTLHGVLRAFGSVLALWRAWRTWHTRRGGRAGRTPAP